MVGLNEFKVPSSAQNSIKENIQLEPSDLIDVKSFPTDK